MIRGMTVKNGVVANIAEFKAEKDLFEGWQLAPKGVAIGDIDNGYGAFKPPEIEEKLK